MIVFKTLVVIGRTLAVTSVVGLAGCAPWREDQLQRELYASQAELQRYQAKYGKLDASEGKRNFRDLKIRLRGRTMAEVSGIMGRPSQVENRGRLESWTYLNAAYDPASKRVVREMKVWFEHGIVDETRAYF